MGGSSRKIEMTWVCTSCGHRNLGRFKECQQCGNPKDASEKFEMPSDTAAAATVTDPKLLGHARAGADWRCTYCGTDNRALESQCVHCGSERGATPNVKQLAPAMAPAIAARPRGWIFGKLLGAGAVVFGLGFAGVAALFGVLLVVIATREPPAPPPVAQPDRPRVVTATVFAREWRCTLRSERRRIIEHEGFEESRPADAFDVVPAGRATTTTSRSSTTTRPRRTTRTSRSRTPRRTPRTSRAVRTASTSPSRAASTAATTGTGSRAARRRAAAAASRAARATAPRPAPGP